MPLTIPQLYTALSGAGFHLRRLAGNAPKPNARRLGLLMPLIRSATRHTVPSPRLRRLLLSPPAIYSEILILVAQ